MIKKIITSFSLLLSLVSFAQEGTSSPYSFYGIGDVRFKGTIENRSMAGVAVEQDSIHINLENPSSFANLKLTTFSVGGTFNRTNLKTDTKSEYAKRTTFDYLAVGLPIGNKFGAGFGLLPYSSVGYKIQNTSDETGGNNQRFSGSGGLNKVFFSLAYAVTPDFKVGADVHYHFGKIETNSLEYVTGVPLGTKEVNSADLSGVNFNFGAMYQTKINDKLQFFSSLNYTLESKLSSENVRTVGVGNFGSEFEFSAVEADEQEMSNKNLTLPSEFKLGAGIGEPRKWLVGAQFAVSSIGDIENTYNTTSNASYEKSMKYRLGGYFIPDYDSFTSYAKRITYRAGFKYDKTGLIVNSESIEDIGLNIGLGIPVGGTFSNINFGFEFGKRGTTSSDLVQENYTCLSVGFSFNDKWFVKRKYN